MNSAEKIVMRQIDALIPYASNARTHSPDQIAQIAARRRVPRSPFGLELYQRARALAKAAVFLNSLGSAHQATSSSVQPARDITIRCIGERSRQDRDASHRYADPLREQRKDPFSRSNRPNRGQHQKFEFTNVLGEQGNGSSASIASSAATARSRRTSSAWLRVQTESETKSLSEEGGAD